MRGKGRAPHAVASNEPDSPDVEQSSYFGCGARSHPSIALPGTPILPLQVTWGDNDALLASAADHRLQHDHGLAEIAPPVRLPCKTVVMLKGPGCAGFKTLRPLQNDLHQSLRARAPNFCVRLCDRKVQPLRCSFLIPIPESLAGLMEYCSEDEGSGDMWLP